MPSLPDSSFSSAFSTAFGFSKAGSLVPLKKRKKWNPQALYWDGEEAVLIDGVVEQIEEAIKEAPVSTPAPVRKSAKAVVKAVKLGREPHPADIKRSKQLRSMPPLTEMVAAQKRGLQKIDDEFIEKVLLGEIW
jgi:hypothetical protein